MAKANKVQPTKVKSQVQSKIKPTYRKSYPWAVNPLKLIEAITDLEDAKKLNPAVVIDEESIAERYELRKGAFAAGIHPFADKEEENTDDESSETEEEETTGTEEETKS